MPHPRNFSVATETQRGTLVTLLVAAVAKRVSLVASRFPRKLYTVYGSFDRSHGHFTELSGHFTCRLRCLRPSGVTLHTKGCPGYSAFMHCSYIKDAFRIAGPLAGVIQR